VATERLIELIKFHEGWRAVAYLDPVNVWTIGWGRTEGVYETEQTTPEHEMRWLHDTLGYISDSIIEIVNDDVALSQNQLDALTSFCYNLGVNAFRKSTLLVRLNAQDFGGAADEFGRWIFAGGKPLRGLIIRREAEKNLFLHMSDEQW
jgi:lysozyme